MKEQILKRGAELRDRGDRFFGGGLSSTSARVANAEGTWTRAVWGADTEATGHGAVPVQAQGGGEAGGGGGGHPSLRLCASTRQRSSFERRMSQCTHAPHPITPPPTPPALSNPHTHRRKAARTRAAAGPFGGRRRRCRCPPGSSFIPWACLLLFPLLPHYTQPQQTMGFLADMFDDILEEPWTIPHKPNRCVFFLCGWVVIDDKPGTELSSLPTHPLTHPPTHPPTHHATTATTSCTSGAAPPRALPPTAFALPPTGPSGSSSASSAQVRVPPPPFPLHPSTHPPTHPLNSKQNSGRPLPQLDLRRHGQRHGPQVAHLPHQLVSPTHPPTLP